MRMLLLLLLLAFRTGAADFKFTWTASITPGTSNVLYFSTNSLTVTNWVTKVSARIPAGTNTTATVSDLIPGKWNIGAAAVKGGFESVLSNVLVLETPQPPSDVRALVVSYGATITGMSNNLFFKVRFDP